MKHKYDVGDTLTWRRWNGDVHTAEVQERDEKNDRPVYDMDNGEWCYEDQVL